MDNMAFNYDSTANTPLPCYYVPGCMSPAYLEYHIDTSNGVYTDINIQDSCNVLAVFGCTDSTQFNYDSTANVDNGGCAPVITGCMESLAFNYNPLANTPDTCIAYVYGCTDATMFNYNPLANADDGSCEPYIFGCTDSTMFNFNPLVSLIFSGVLILLHLITTPKLIQKTLAVLIISTAVPIALLLTMIHLLTLTTVRVLLWSKGVWTKTLGTTKN